MTVLKSQDAEKRIEAALEKLELSAHAWRSVSKTWGVESGAAKGELLDLVRTVWGRYVSPEATDSMPGEWWRGRGFKPGMVGPIAWILDLPIIEFCDGETELEALVVGLEKKVDYANT